MRRLIIASAVTVLAATTVTGSGLAHDGPNWKMLERNPSLLGQVAGCLLRIEYYFDRLDPTGDEEAKRRTIEVMVGDIPPILERLKALYNKGSMPHGNFATVEAEVSGQIQQEIHTGTALLQMLGCGIMLKDYNIIE